MAVTVPHISHCYRRASLVAALLFAFMVFALPVMAAQPEHVQPPASAAAGEHAATAEHEGGSAGEHEEGWLPTIAKVVNFTVLVGVLAYFLKSPIAQHLAARHDSIRKDLIDAKTIRESAEMQLSTVRSRLSELPAELEALRARGRDELAQERVRLQAATVREREQLVERTRREIDLQARVARRELTVHTAELTTRLARTRIEKLITPQDQTRLVDRYTADVQA